MPELDFRRMHEVTGWFTRRRVITGLLAVVVVLVALSCWFTVQPDETGVVLRLGRAVRTAGPGLHGQLPFGIETVYLVPTSRVLTEEFGFRTVRSDRRSTFDKNAKFDESLILTGDLNVIDVEWIVQYRIEDPYRFLFRVREPGDALRDVSESVMRRVIGNRPAAEVLTVGRTAVAAEARDEIQRVVTEYETGIKILTVELQDVTPPEAVRAAFNEVNEARQDRERKINEAQERANRELPRARGEAMRTISAAEGHALERVNQARGEASHFRSALAAYRKVPEVTQTRLYLEAMQDVLKRSRAVYVMDREQRSVLPWLPLEPPPLASPAPPVAPAPARPPAPPAPPVGAAPSTATEVAP